MPLKNKIKLNRWLAPIAFLYGVGLAVRNMFYDRGWFKSVSYSEVPIICIGNLALGGTGKTPHTEYLLRELCKKYRIAVLSRGYKRKSKGFVLANETSTSAEIGDEPYQIKQKFPACIVAVDANRNRGIQKLLALPKGNVPELILLDDAFQHRAVMPSFSILLTKASNLYVNDRLFPVGRLREPIKGAERANVIVVTKCDNDLSPIDFRIIERSLPLRPMQQLFFSKIVYDTLQPLYPALAEKERTILSDTEVLLVAGIESPEYMIEEVRKRTKNVHTILYPDHHDFVEKDYTHIDNQYQALPKEKRMILLSEKDAARMKDNPLLPAEWKKDLYCLPIRVSFLKDNGKILLEQIEKQLK